MPQLDQSGMPHMSFSSSIEIRAYARYTVHAGERARPNLERREVPETIVDRPVARSALGNSPSR